MDKDDSESSIESHIDSASSGVLESAETSVQPPPLEPIEEQQVEVVSYNSRKESTETLSTSSIIELCQQCTSAFETCTHHESLIKLKREWAGERFFDFNIYINCIGVRSPSRAFLDYRLDSGQSTRLLLSNILTMLKKFLAECISCAEAQSGIDAATKKVDTSIKCLSQIMEAIIRPGIRSRLPQGDCTERDQQDNVDDPIKASTTQGNSWFQEAEKKASQPAIVALTALRPADRYPRAPKLPQGATAFKRPCCCETLPAEFANDDKLWRYYSQVS
ncbi:hypothetical protein T069G_05076 [Trichoderma breve]|uniref:Uncharacterized protein n=1 Tax=Trichoderma breve TaxID=2034170 RepID=A0A9W9E5R4_9HYPO|nr:hypothetical protein T069G_05076 [Trichoderma breve]KAJ4860088.1 hypothetical protein T069G_05076 [Trichoderma breve]